MPYLVTRETLTGTGQLPKFADESYLSERDDLLPRLKWYAEGANISFEYLGVGLGTAAFTAFIARETSRVYAATQFALFTALAALPRTFANASTGWIVERIGWVDFFLLCAVLAIPGMLLLFWVAPWNERRKEQGDRA